MLACPWFVHANISGVVSFQVDMKDTDLYKEDWIGLRALDESGRLVLGSVPGQHMHFTLQWLLDNVVHPYLRGPAAIGDVATARA